MSRTRAFVIATALATLIGLTAAIAGGIFVRSPDVADCVGPCVNFSKYG